MRCSRPYTALKMSARSCFCTRPSSWDCLALLGILEGKRFLGFFWGEGFFKLGFPFAHSIPCPVPFLEDIKVPKIYSSFFTESQQCIFYLLVGNPSPPLFPFPLLHLLLNRSIPLPPSPFAFSITFLGSSGFEETTVERDLFLQ